MAKRFIDTGIFRKPSIRAMKAPYKALFIYLLCECDHAGVWEEEIDVAAMRLGMDLDRDTALAELGASVVAVGSKWFLADFVAYQYGELNPANRVHASVISRLQAIGIDHENKPLTSPLKGAKDKEKDKDTSSEKEHATPFENWWKLYGKGSRKLSAEVWAKMPEADRVACIAKTPSYIAAKPDPTYRKDGERFLKHRTWEDPIVTPGQAPTVTAPPATGWATTKHLKPQRA